MSQGGPQVELSSAPVVLIRYTSALNPESVLGGSVSGWHINPDFEDSILHNKIVHKTV